MTDISKGSNKNYHSMTKLEFYSRPTKLREGNVFTGVCQSFCSQGGGVGSYVGAEGGYSAPGHMGPGILRGTVNKRAVRILLEYILV